MGSELALLDCLTCDKCIPVCPNGANFAVALTPGAYQPGRVTWMEGTFRRSKGKRLVVEKKHQIVNTADACNECGHCDTWCPEDGGPYRAKPALFLTQSTWNALDDRDGFLLMLERRSLAWRRDGHVYRYSRFDDGTAELDVGTGAVLLEEDKPIRTIGTGDVDLTVAVTLRLYLEGLTAPDTQAWL